MKVTRWRHEWAKRRQCARAADAVEAAEAANLTFNLLGVDSLRTNGELEAALPLLRAGDPRDCESTQAVAEDLVEHAWLGRGKGWGGHLAAHGHAPIDASWGFSALLRRNGLARRLIRRLGVNKVGDGDGPIASIRTSENDTDLLNLTRAVLDRVSPLADAYFGMPASFGIPTLLLLPGRNRSSSEYVSGLFHHDRCGRRLKCFVFLTRVGHDAHPMLLVPNTHRTAYYSYGDFAASRFDAPYISAAYPPPVAMRGEPGEGFCFDTNGIHRGTLEGSRPRYAVIYEFHNARLEKAFARAHAGAPFGSRRS